jgi:hypothetical protein
MKILEIYNYEENWLTLNAELNRETLESCHKAGYYAFQLSDGVDYRIDEGWLWDHVKPTGEFVTEKLQESEENIAKFELDYFCDDKEAAKKLIGDHNKTVELIKARLEATQQ